MMCTAGICFGRASQCSEQSELYANSSNDSLSCTAEVLDFRVYVLTSG